MNRWSGVGSCASSTARRKRPSARFTGGAYHKLTLTTSGISPDLILFARWRIRVAAASVACRLDSRQQTGKRIAIDTATNPDFSNA